MLSSFPHFTTISMGLLYKITAERTAHLRNYLRSLEKYKDKKPREIQRQQQQRKHEPLKLTAIANSKHSLTYSQINIRLLDKGLFT